MAAALDAVAWPVKTSRLSLRPATPADLGPTWRYRRLEAVSRWLVREPQKSDDVLSLVRDPRPTVLVVQVEPGVSVSLENNELLRHHGGVLPLLRLTDLFGTPRPAGAFPALVVGEGGGTVALAADRVLGLREIVVRPLADPPVQVPGLAGATELGDGRPVLILDAAGLTRYARTRLRPTT